MTPEKRMNNAVCEWCKQPFRMKPHYIARKLREGTPITCSRSCAGKLASRRHKEEQRKQEQLDLDAERLKIWKDGYNQAVLDMGGIIE